MSSTPEVCDGAVVSDLGTQPMKREAVCGTSAQPADAAGSAALPALITVKKEGEASAASVSAQSSSHGKRNKIDRARSMPPTRCATSTDDPNDRIKRTRR